MALRGPASRFFFYGTLLDPDIARRVVGRDVTLEPAWLSGYRRVRAAGKWYPILVPGTPDDTVEGAVAGRLTRSEIARLVAYEGANYRLWPIGVVLAGGASARALVFRPRRSLKATGEPWDLASWQEREKPRVMRLALWA
ncbi:MAG: gamma-glutamylcyclotransferase [Alphaproteobacteria bacterium]|nr:gamma-glutamylcyclotransferase [Alphaproteobacteria bacterium]